MADDRFARIAHHLRGSEEPRPEFVASLHAELVDRLEHGPAMRLAAEPRARRRPIWIAAAAALIGVLVIGVPLLLLRSGEPGDGPVATTAPGPGEVVLKPGRPTGIPLTGDVAGFYMLYLPAGYESGPLPVILALADESGGQSGGLGLWGTDSADELGTAIVSLAPTGTIWSFARSEEEAATLDPGPAGSIAPFGSADTDLITAVLDDVAQRIEAGPVFVAGQNNGGLMAGRVACEIADRFAAVATYPNAVYLPTGCSPSRMVPLMSYGPSEETTERGILAADAAASMEAWAELASCEGFAETTPEPGVSTATYDGCRDGATYVLNLLDATASDRWDAPSTAMWPFFQSHGSSE